MSTALSATAALRAWALKAILPSPEHNTGIEGAECEGFKPFDFPGSSKLIGVLMDFKIPYVHDPWDSDGPTADLCADLVFQKLQAATPYPTGLLASKILDHEILPLEPTELPAVGVYLVEDTNQGEAGIAEGISNRAAIIQIQINNIL